MATPYRRSSHPRPPAAPSVPRRDVLQTPGTDLEPDAQWDGVLAGPEDAPDLADGPALISGAEIRESALESLRLSGARADGLRLTDVTLTGCDLSGLVADGALLARVRFVDCRLIGMVLSDARLTDVAFLGCHADMLNLRMARVRRMHLADTRARQCDLFEAEVTDLTTEHADLREADLSRARLASADLRGAELEGVRGPSGLRGALISAEQVLAVGVALIGEAGIRVE